MMIMLRSLSRLVARLRSASSPRASSRRPARPAGRRLALEELQARELMSTTPLHAALAAPATLAVNSPGTFQVTPSGGVSPYHYNFSFGDGTATQASSSASLQHTYPVNGQYG